MTELFLKIRPRSDADEREFVSLPKAQKEGEGWFSTDADVARYHCKLLSIATSTCDGEGSASSLMAAGGVPFQGYSPITLGGRGRNRPIYLRSDLYLANELGGIRRYFGSLGVTIVNNSLEVLLEVNPNP